MLQRRIDHALGAREVGHVFVVGDGLAARFDDFARHGFGSAFGGVFASVLARPGHAEVVDDDACAMRGQLQRVFATDAAAGAGHDHDAVFTKLGHQDSLDELGCRCAPGPAAASREC
ncbi:hypothetical protein D3C72_1643100 [compost metagenome]